MIAYPMMCGTCGTIGTADDGIEVGGECAHEWCDGTIVAAPGIDNGDEQTYVDSRARINLDWLHSLVQELEHQGVELPMGDYAYVYSIIESLRDGAE